jgi:hypothetical protein
MTKQSRSFHSSWVSVYDGRTCRGHVLARGRSGFEGFDIDDQSLGTFKTQAEAIAAVSGGRRGDE